MYLGLRSGSEAWITGRRGKCSLGKKGLSDSAVARLDLFVGALKVQAARRVRGHAPAEDFEI